MMSWANNLIIKNCLSRKLLVLMLIIGGILAVYLSMKSYAAPSLFGSMRVFSVGILIFAAILAMALLFLTPDPVDRVALYGLVLLFVFGMIILYQVYGVYLVDGRLRAAHGRYFYPVIPILLLSISIAVLRLRVPAFFIAVVTLILAYVELETYLLQAIPFYLSGEL